MTQKRSDVSKSCDNMIKRTDIIAFTKCYHNQPNPAVDNASELPCSLCEIDKYFEENIDEEVKAYAALKIKMEKDNLKTIYFIKNDYVSLSATMPVNVYNKHKQFITLLQISTRIIIIMMMILIIVLCITSFYLLLIQ